MLGWTRWQTVSVMLALPRPGRFETTFTGSPSASSRVAVDEKVVPGWLGERIRRLSVL
jgi:hypothetical protein